MSAFFVFLAVPVCFIVMSNRKTETYEAIFRCLQKLGSKEGIEFNPGKIICDFEQSFMNAVQTEVR